MVKLFSVSDEFRLYCTKVGITPFVNRSPGRPRTNYRGTVKKDLQEDGNSPGKRPSTDRNSIVVHPNMSKH